MPANTKRIAKNTVMLYIRMLLMMAVTLYTSRVILKVLGVDDYGIYNLVGGFVMLFSFISQALTSAVQRFLNVALGRGDKEYYQNIFSSSINIFILLSILVIIIGETVGVWFVNTQLNIPNGRMEAAKWVFQLSLLVFIAGILRTPYNASIIAHEKMNFYAYISIFEAVIKLGVVFLLQLFDFDKLILYAILFLTSIVVVNIIYMVYCHRQFAECSYKWVWDKHLFGELLSMSGWSLLGQMAAVGRTQGENFIINRYHSVSANAAKGVSSQLTGALHQFVTNFQTAFNPQLIQTYAAGEMQDHVKLLFRACKFSYYLMLLIAVPAIFNIDFILTTWLTEIPRYSVGFCIWGLLSYLFSALYSPLTSTIYAHGKIRNYQLAIATIHLFVLITSFLVLRKGFAPYSVVVVGVCYQVVIMLVSMYHNFKLTNIKISSFSRMVILPTIFTTFISIILPSGILWMNFEQNFLISLLVCGVEAAWTAGIVYMVGLEKGEKEYLKSIVKNRMPSK